MKPRMCKPFGERVALDRKDLAAARVLFTLVRRDKRMPVKKTCNIFKSCFGYGYTGADSRKRGEMCGVVGKLAVALPLGTSLVQINIRNGAAAVKGKALALREDRAVFGNSARAGKYKIG